MFTRLKKKNPAGQSSKSTARGQGAAAAAAPAVDMEKEKVAGESSAKNLECEQSSEVQASERNALFEKLKDKIVIIYTFHEEDEVRIFTGFYVGDGLILTSETYLKTATNIFVCGHDYGKTDNGPRFTPFNHVAFNGWLGILHVEATDHSYVPIVHIEYDIAAPAVGRSVYSISHPQYNYFSLMCGSVVSPLKKMDEAGFLAHNGLQVTQLRGLSGGEPSSGNKGYKKYDEVLGAPVFDNNGDLVGMIIECDRGFEYAVPTSVLVDCLRRYYDPVQ